MIIMHFIVNETNDTQVFQGQHLTEHHYKEKKSFIQKNKQIFSKLEVKQNANIVIFY